MQIQSTPIQYLTTINGKKLFIKRDDLNHPSIQGNKFRKLKYTLQLAKEKQHTLISFGGAYSNHIAALAAAGKLFHLPTVGIIRGDELVNQSRWGKTLITAEKNGMKLHFISRRAYREKIQSPEIKNIIQCYQNPLVIPEGGSNELAVKGVSEIIGEITEQSKQPFQRLFAACGTGGTLSGLIDGAKQYQFPTQITGIPVLKGAAFLYEAIRQLSQYHDAINWSLIFDYHFGGYARSTPTLQAFIEKFEKNYNVEIEPIYTGKLCYGVFDLARKSPPTKENWLIYHSGGLQGK